MTKTRFVEKLLEGQGTLLGKEGEPIAQVHYQLTIKTSKGRGKSFRGSTACLQGKSEMSVLIRTETNLSDITGLLLKLEDGRLVKPTLIGEKKPRHVGSGFEVWEYPIPGAKFVETIERKD